MCDAVTIALTAAKSAMEIKAQNDAAAAQTAHYYANRNNAVQARDLKVNQANLRANQEVERLSEEKRQSQIEALEIASKQYVAAGESGVSGNSVIALLRQTEGKQLRNETSINSEITGILAQNEVDAEAYNAEAQSRINSVKMGTPADTLGIIAGNSIASAGTYYSANEDLGIFST
jgi:hypothetical protein